MILFAKANALTEKRLQIVRRYLFEGLKKTPILSTQTKKRFFFVPIFLPTQRMPSTKPLRRSGKWTDGVLLHLQRRQRRLPGRQRQRRRQLVRCGRERWWLWGLSTSAAVFIIRVRSDDGDSHGLRHGHADLQSDLLHEASVRNAGVRLPSGQRSSVQECHRRAAPSPTHGRRSCQLQGAHSGYQGGWSKTIPSFALYTRTLTHV